MIASLMERVTPTVTLEVAITTIEASMAQITTVSEGTMKKMIVSLTTGKKIMVAVRA